MDKEIRVKNDYGQALVRARPGSRNSNRFRARAYTPKAQSTNPFLDFANINAGYKEKRSELSYETLDNCAKKVGPLSAVINTRIDQIGLFTSQARHDENNVGFRVRLKDQNEDPSEKQEEEMREIEEFIYRCGRQKDFKRDNFDTFVRKIMRDSLIYDQVNFEMVRDVNGEIVEFIAVDAKTIRAATDDFQADTLKDLSPAEDEEVEYVQIINGNVEAWFTAEEMAFVVRNPRTDISVQPYGFSEIETIVTQLNSYLEAEEYNMRFFEQGGMTKGVFNIKNEPSGYANQDAMQSFKRQWRSQVTGLKGAWKTPILQVPGGLEYINIGQDNGEMVFEKWVNYLINIICAVYRIDPAEINFPNNGGAAGGGGGIFEGSTQAKYDQSKDKGLYPLMQFIENTINKYIMPEFGDQYVFKFDGMNEKTQEEQNQIDKQEVDTFKTINEKRRERGLPDIDGGDVVANPYYMQSLQTAGGGGLPFDFDFGDEGGEMDIEEVDGDEDQDPGQEEEGQEDREELGKSIYYL